MKHRTHGVVLSLVIVILTVACARTFSQYTPRRDLPRMIYVQGELGRLETDADKLAAATVFVEVTTKEGVTGAGKLIRITDCHLVMNPISCSSSADAPDFALESEKLIPKDEILVLKVF